MEVILLERIESLGQMGDVVNVKPGYARNYLLPQKKALRATEENRRHFEEHRAQLETVNVERRTAAEQVATRLEGLAVVLIRQAGEAGQLYGSVNARDIAHEVTRAGFTMERRQVQLPQPIKALGLYEVRIALHPEVGTGVTVNVARSADEAQIQAKTGKAVVQLEEEEKEKEEKAATGQEEKGREGEAPATRPLRGLVILMPVVGTQGIQEGLEVLRLSEVAIDRGEAHVGDLIQIGERVHDQLADVLRAHLGLARALEATDDAVDHQFDPTRAIECARTS